MKKALRKSVPITFLMALILFCNSACAQDSLDEQAKLVLADKTIWLVDVNTTERYVSMFQQALFRELPQVMPGIKLQEVLTSEKGNPFFMLKKEKYPDAVIICLSVCEATTKNVANYASEARKKGIPAVIIYDEYVQELQQQWNANFRNAEQASIGIRGMPETMEMATPVAREVSPVLAAKLIQFLKI